MTESKSFQKRRNVQRGGRPVVDEDRNVECNAHRGKCACPDCVEEFKVGCVHCGVKVSSEGFEPGVDVTCESCSAELFEQVGCEPCVECGELIEHHPRCPHQMDWFDQRAEDDRNRGDF